MERYNESQLKCLKIHAKEVIAIYKDVQTTTPKKRTWKEEILKDFERELILINKELEKYE